MAAPQYIDINDFMSRLKQEGLIIVRADEHELASQAKLAALQQRYLRRKALTIGEIIEAKLFSTSSRTTIQRWINEGTIRATEVIPASDGKGTVKILVTAIKRIAPEWA